MKAVVGQSSAQCDGEMCCIGGNKRQEVNMSSINSLARRSDLITVRFNTRYHSSFGFINFVGRRLTIKEVSSQEVSVILKEGLVQILEELLVVLLGVKFIRGIEVNNVNFLKYSRS